MLRLSEEYESKNHSFKGRGRVENDFQETLFISRTALDVRYGVTDDWTLDLTATYPHFTYRLKPPGGERIERRFRGPGDTFLSMGRQFVFGDPSASPARCRLMEAVAHTEGSAPAAQPPVFVSVWAGVSLPTGSPERPNPAIVTRDVSVSNLQTGTGTFDPLARLRAEWPQTGFTPFAEAAIRFPVYENTFRYHTADTEALVLGASVPIVPKLSASLSAMYQRTGRDRFRGDDVGVGGAKWIYAVPGLAWQVTESAAIDVSARLPVYRGTETKLSDSAVVYQIGVSWRF